MNREAVLKWIEALEGGAYRQASGALRKRDGYCCLGVACDLSGVGSWVRDNLSVATTYTDGTFASPSYLPEGVSSFYGVDMPLQRELGRMNDNGASFTEIAARLRQELALETPQ